MASNFLTIYHFFVIILIPIDGITSNGGGNTKVNVGGTVETIVDKTTQLLPKTSQA